MKINRIKFNSSIKNKLEKGAKIIIGTTLLTGITSNMINNQPVTKNIILSLRPYMNLKTVQYMISHIYLVTRKARSTLPNGALI